MPLEAHVVSKNRPGFSGQNDSKKDNKNDTNFRENSLGENGVHFGWREPWFVIV